MPGKALVSLSGPLFFRTIFEEQKSPYEQVAVRFRKTAMGQPLETFFYTSSHFVELA